MTGDQRVWRQVETLLGHATERVHLIAPFIKLDAFRAAIAAVPDVVQSIDCVTRWSVTEVAAGVSDPEIIELTQHDPRIKIRLCHNLHAKLFLADSSGLAGSANLTNKALGRTPQHNLELLVGTDLTEPEVQYLLDSIDATAVKATAEMAAAIRQQANLFAQADNTVIVAGDSSLNTHAWYPATRRPDRLYGVYSGRADAPSAVKEGVSYDLALLDVAPGLDEAQFNDHVKARLFALPEVQQLLSGERLNNLDIQQSVAQRAAIDDREARRITETIAEWLKHFGHFYMDVATWELRPGQELG